jgi:hypothetical protein
MGQGKFSVGNKGERKRFRNSTFQNFKKQERQTEKARLEKGHKKLDWDKSEGFCSYLLKEK